MILFKVHHRILTLLSLVTRSVQLCFWPTALVKIRRRKSTKRSVVVQRLPATKSHRSQRHTLAVSTMIQLWALLYAFTFTSRMMTQEEITLINKEWKWKSSIPVRPNWKQQTARASSMSGGSVCSAHCKWPIHLHIFFNWKLSGEMMEIR